MGPARYCQHLIVCPEKKIKQEPVAAHMAQAGKLCQKDTISLWGTKGGLCTHSVFLCKARGTGSRIFAVNYPKTNGKQLKGASVEHWAFKTACLSAQLLNVLFRETSQAAITCRSQRGKTHLLLLPQ